jgi:hypothetical protein
MKRVLPLLCLMILIGCSKKSSREAEVGEWQRLGECEVKVDLVRFGRVKGKGMLGPSESDKEVLIVRTLFRNVDESAQVKHSPWQTDGSILAVGIGLTDDNGVRYQSVHFGMFGEIEGRQKGDAELKADDEPVADLLTFEGKGAGVEVLHLELPPRWFVKGPKGWGYNSLKEEKFRFRIPRSAWEGPKKPQPKK